MTAGKLDRRALLLRLAAAPALLPLAQAAQAQQAGLITGSVCLVQPETTAGPFYVDPGLVRRDITEGRDGAPTRLRLQVVTAECAPVAGARVDVWHCDARGVYSGVQGQGGTTFLRGTQFSDEAGVAAFDTIYPGWYPGRTPHVHYKVFLNDRTVLTSQLFLPDRASATVYENVAPYAARGAQDRLNAADGIARRAGPTALAAVAGTTAALTVDLVVGVAA